MAGSSPQDKTGSEWVQTPNRPYLHTIRQLDMGPINLTQLVGMYNQPAATTQRGADRIPSGGRQIPRRSYIMPRGTYWNVVAV